MGLEGIALLQGTKQSRKWVITVAKSFVFFALLIVINFIFVNSLGSQIWSNLGYLFGSDMRTTLGVLLFGEGGILPAIGSLWSFGSSQNVSYGMYRKNYGAFSKEDWETRKKQTENPSDVVNALLFIGGFTLISSILLFLI